MYIAGHPETLVQETSVADPVHFSRIRIRGSGSYLDMFLMFNKINNFLWYFYTESNHLMTLKIKEKKYVDETVVYTILYNHKIRITVFFCG